MRVAVTNRLNYPSEKLSSLARKGRIAKSTGPVSRQEKEPSATGKSINVKVSVLEAAAMAVSIAVLIGHLSGTALPFGHSAWRRRQRLAEGQSGWPAARPPDCPSASASEEEAFPSGGMPNSFSQLLQGVLVTRQSASFGALCQAEEARVCSLSLSRRGERRERRRKREREMGVCV